MTKSAMFYVKITLSLAWLAFTFSLVVWWWIFFLLRFNPTKDMSFEQLQRSHYMLAWEGAVLLTAIFVGGVALVTFVYLDQKHHHRLRLFFSTFSHDIKTSITRLRLQAEILEEDQPSNPSSVLKRLIQDIRRLDLQLENSLILAHFEGGSFLKEKVSLHNLLGSLRNEFPEITLELERNAFIFGDRRALLSIFKNILQNSVIHGKATKVSTKAHQIGNNRLELEFIDNGIGFTGPIEKLGSEILKSQESHSNGIGLLITKRLLKKMNGNILFESSEKNNHGFKATIRLEGHLG